MTSHPPRDGGAFPPVAFGEPRSAGRSGPTTDFGDAPGRDLRVEWGARPEHGRPVCHFSFLLVVTKTLNEREFRAGKLVGPFR